MFSDNDLLAFTQFKVHNKRRSACSGWIMFLVQCRRTHIWLVYKWLSDRWRQKRESGPVETSNGLKEMLNE